LLLIYEEDFVPTLELHQPVNNATVTPNQPFVVSGQATDRGKPEPIMIDSVTVQVDSQPPIKATLTRIPNQQKTTVTFKASVQVTGGQDPHTVTVIATNDNGISQTKTVSVFTGPQVDAPAIFVDFLNPLPLDPKDSKVISWMSQIQQRVQTLSDSLASIGKMLVGPNLVFINNPSSLQIMRLGFWIEDSSFSVVKPSPPDFPLPRLTDQAAAVGFAKVPVSTIPQLAGFSPSFAFSIPVTTLQHLLDVVLPTVQAAAASSHASVNTLTVQTNSAGSVSTTISGSALHLGFSVTITEVLGTKTLENGQLVPAVTGHSHSVSAGSVLDWLVGLIFPIFDLALLGALGYLSVSAGDASDQFNGIVQPLIAGFPPQIPFSNAMLPKGVPAPDFPVLILNWKTFGTTASGIVGTGTTALENRDQSMVALSINGSSYISGYQVDLAGGAGQNYRYTLVNLAPDADKFRWQTSGTLPDSGVINRDNFDQSGNFNATFKLPLKVTPNKYSFTLAVSATETCGSDPKKKLSASSSTSVIVEVKKNPKVPL
jgi:hypothetical protein